MTKREKAVTFKGTPKDLIGAEVKVGAKAPGFKCLGAALNTVTLADTPVCSTQTKKFEDGIKSLGDKVACYTVSLDLPFAQKRFCSAEGCSTMQTLSDVADNSFGTNWGVLLDGLPLKLLARSVFVVDKSGTVTYAEYVPEVTSEPNYSAALAALSKAAA
jgi:thiol peroxidase